MGYGVIGSPTGSGPVSLGSSPGTPATWLSMLRDLRSLAGGVASYHPGAEPPGPRVSGTGRLPGDPRRGAQVEQSRADPAARVPDTGRLPGDPQRWA